VTALTDSESETEKDLRLYYFGQGMAVPLTQQQ